MAWTVLKSWQLLKEGVGQSQSSLWRPEELVLISQGGLSIDHTFVLFLGSLCKMGAIFCRTGFKIKLILMGVLNQQLAGIGDVMNLGWLLFVLNLCSLQSLSGVVVSCRSTSWPEVDNEPGPRDFCRYTPAASPWTNFIQNFSKEDSNTFVWVALHWVGCCLNVTEVRSGSITRRWDWTPGVPEPEPVAGKPWDKPGRSERLDFSCLWKSKPAAGGLGGFVTWLVIEVSRQCTRRVKWKSQI